MQDYLVLGFVHLVFSFVHLFQSVALEVLEICVRESNKSVLGARLNQGGKVRLGHHFHIRICAGNGFLRIANGRAARVFVSPEIALNILQSTSFGFEPNSRRNHALDKRYGFEPSLNKMGGWFLTNYALHSKTLSAPKIVHFRNSH